VTLPCFDAVVFDFDGVLVTSVDVKTQAFADLYAEHGPDVVRKVTEYHLAHGGVSRFEKFRHFHRAFLKRNLTPEAESRLGIRFSAMVENAVVEAPWIAGAREFLERHHRQVPLFVASGTPEQELLRIIARRGASHYFAGAGGAPRSKAEIISAFIRKGGYDAARVLMIGDSSTDYEGARAAGVRFLGVAEDRNAALAFFPPEVPYLRDFTGLEAFLEGQSLP
jgi:HAD superfamily hydrolase (TIGR01549 family)